MGNLVVLALSLFFLALGLVFIYKPTWIVIVNKFLRERVFNDNRVLLERRKKGFFFLLMFFIFFYWGYFRLQYAPFPVTDKVISTERLLYQSLQHIHLKEYAEAQLLCQKVLDRDPNNSEALYQMAAARYRLGDLPMARDIWAKAEKISPDSITRRRLQAIGLEPRKAAAVK